MPSCHSRLSDQQRCGLEPTHPRRVGVAMRRLLVLLPLSVACSTMPASEFERRATIIACHTADRCDYVAFEECMLGGTPTELVDDACVVDGQSARQCFSALRHLDCEFPQSTAICTETIAPCRADGGVP